MKDLTKLWGFNWLQLFLTLHSLALYHPFVPLNTQSWTFGFSGLPRSVRGLQLLKHYILLFCKIYLKKYTYRNTLYLTWSSLVLCFPIPFLLIPLVSVWKSGHICWKVLLAIHETLRAVSGLLLQVLIEVIICSVVPETRPDVLELHWGRKIQRNQKHRRPNFACWWQIALLFQPLTSMCSQVHLITYYCMLEQ